MRRKYTNKRTGLCLCCTLNWLDCWCKLSELLQGVHADVIGCSFPNVGIQCCKRHDVEDSLKNREKIRVDPFGSKSVLLGSSYLLGLITYCYQTWWWLCFLFVYLSLCYLCRITQKVLDKVWWIFLEYVMYD